MIHNHIYAAQGKIVIVGSYNPDAVRAIKHQALAFEDRQWNKPPFPSAWQLTPSDITAGIVERLRDEFGYGVDPSVWHTLRDTIHDQSEMVLLSQAHEAEFDVPSLALDLVGFQKASALYCCKAKRTWLADDTGLGKTPVVIAVAEHENAFPVIIIAKNSVKLQWVEEIAKWAPHRTAISLKTQPKGDLPRADYYIVGYGSLQNWVDELRMVRPKLVAADEAHMVKNPAALRTKAAIKLAEKAEYVLAVTATPEANGPVDGVGQLMFIRRLKELFVSRRAFEIKYCEGHECVMPNGARTWNARRCWKHKTRGARFLDELAQIYAEHCKVRHVKRGVNGVANQLPPFLETIVPIELSNRAEYETCITDYKAKIREAADTGAYMPDWEHLVHLADLRRLAADGKIAGAIEWLEDWLGKDEHGHIPSDGPLMVVFGDFREPLERIAAHFGADIIYGGISDERRQAIKIAFQTRNNSSRLLLCGIKAASEGLNLDAAEAVAFFQEDWSSTTRLQAKNRIDRITQQAERLTAYHLLAEDTIDITVHKLLERKEDVVVGINDSVAGTRQDLKQHIIERLEAEALGRGA